MRQLHNLHADDVVAHCRLGLQGTGGYAATNRLHDAVPAQLALDDKDGSETMIKESADRPKSASESNAASGICGVLLAAGAGRRAGGPKALRVDRDGTFWLLRSIAALLDGGCNAVIVVLGCEAARARNLIARSTLAADPILTVTDAKNWQLGVASSLQTGLLAAQLKSWRAVLVHLVDVPDVTDAVVSRVIRQAPPGTAGLARAAYGGRPGHPVCIGRDHLEAIMIGLTGDSGAKGYLAQHDVLNVECSDLASGQDHDESWPR
jgi:CTP:molybdopterin cytidylyltransferase MocA